MLKKTLLLLIAVLTMTACASGAPPTEGPARIPSAWLMDLPPESLPDPRSNQLPDLKDNHIESAGMYHRLWERFKGLVEWLEKNREVR